MTNFLFPQANEIDFRQITREEAVLILLALGEDVSLCVVPNKAGLYSIFLVTLIVAMSFLVRHSGSQG